MQEQPIFFKNGNYRLFGVIHHPTTTSNNEGVVFCHPPLEEKLWTHRIFVNFARVLAKNNYTVLRFDFYGNGDSDGDFEDSSISTNLSDLDCAIKYLLSFIKLDYIHLVGLRMGGMLASKYLDEPGVDSIKKLVLWEPVADGNRFAQEILRANLATQLTMYNEIRKNRDVLTNELKEGRSVNIEGYEFSNTLFSQVSEINLTKGSKRFDGDVLIVQFCKNLQAKFNKDFENMVATYNNASLIKIKEDPFWRELKHFYSMSDQLFSETLDWLRKDNV